VASLKLYEDPSIDDSTGVPERDPSWPRILIFTEGTVLGFEHWWGYFNVAAYVPIGSSATKIRGWVRQGTRVSYLTSRKRPAGAARVREILREGQFSGDHLYYRGPGEKYHDIAEQVIPDILIEDDCRSIGGRWQMAITHVDETVKRRIRSVVVHEFTGIDHLPDDLGTLWRPGADAAARSPAPSGKPASW
jgi:hypothetical protein